MKFANRLKELRKEHRLSQHELASIIGVSKSAISMYENGNRLPELETFEKIADYFNVDMDYLKGKSSIVRESKSVYYLNDETREIAQEIYDNKDLRMLFDASRKATPEDLKFIVEMARKLKGE
jgi:transcriptional regulator with XRE-family HTH domain